MPNPRRADIQIAGIEGGSAFYITGFDNRAVTGFQKTMNNYMRCLLTLKGSNPFDPTYGTAFAKLPGSNMGGRIDLVQRIVVEAIGDANSQIRNYQIGQPLPNSERLLSASLMEFSTNNTDAISVKILMKNQAGLVLGVLLPSISL